MNRIPERLLEIPCKPARLSAKPVKENDMKSFYNFRHCAVLTTILVSTSLFHGISLNADASIVHVSPAGADSRGFAFMSVKREGAHYFIFEQRAELRAKPGKHGRIISNLSPGTRVKVLSRAVSKSKAPSWYRVKLKGGRVGFVRGAQLAELGFRANLDGRRGQETFLLGVHPAKLNGRSTSLVNLSARIVRDGKVIATFKGPRSEADQIGACSLEKPAGYKPDLRMIKCLFRRGKGEPLMLPLKFVRGRLSHLLDRKSFPLLFHSRRLKGVSHRVLVYSGPGTNRLVMETTDVPLGGCDVKEDGSPNRGGCDIHVVRQAYRWNGVEFRAGKRTARRIRR